MKRFMTTLAVLGLGVLSLVTSRWTGPVTPSDVFLCALLVVIALIYKDCK